MNGSEDRLLAWLRKHLGEGHHLGDDVAFLDLPGAVALTVDQQIEGVHFRPGIPVEVLARRLAAVNLSDLAAAGARPLAALLTLATPPGFPHRRFFSALTAALAAAGAELAGGDLARAERPAFTLTLLGGRWPGGRWLRRDGARPGDRLWLGGTVGESALGQELLARGASWRGRACLPPGLSLPRPLAAAARRAIARHLEPCPQLALGRWLARSGRAGAAIDLSDGLARDLHRLCAASGVGARLETARLPFADGFLPLATRLDLVPERLALGGGEDYVLLFTLPAGVSPPAAFAATEIGRITRSRQLLAGRAGAWTPLPALGWDHLGGAGVMGSRRPSGRA